MNWEVFVCMRIYMSLLPELEIVEQEQRGSIYSEAWKRRLGK